MERASRLDPANAGLLLDLGRMHALRYHYAAAEHCFEKAVRIASKKTETLVTAGQRSRDFGNWVMSERYYLRALEQKDATPEIYVKLAEIYERLRRMKDAADMVERALRLNSACPEALLTRARLERHAGRLEEAERTVRSFVNKPNPDAWVHAQTWYELGAILDRQGRYDDAFAAFVQAKALLRPNAARFLNDLKIVRKRIADMRANISGEIVRRWLDCAPALSPARRLALLGGHPRSGTTLLEQVLDSHPDIVSVEETTIFHDEAYVPLTRSLPENEPMLSVLEAAQTGALQSIAHELFPLRRKISGQTHRKPAVD